MAVQSDFVNFSNISNDNVIVATEDDYHESDCITVDQLLNLVFGDVHEEWETTREKCNNKFCQADFAKYLLSLHNKSCDRCSVDSSLQNEKYEYEFNTLFFID